MRSSIIPILKPENGDAEKHSQHLTIDDCRVKLNFLSEAVFLMRSGVFCLHLPCLNRSATCLHKQTHHVIMMMYLHLEK